ncbi:uncharacterized protein [Cicer arietinum]|uniref:Uncharacterized protein LOC101512034 n=1 Tax=Cicer arietinum TaxID=3827 RepID=A0A1S2YUH4_CICAR|nr:uncharacterized protein LOC101512034 [Cicer arietinum]
MRCKKHLPDLTSTVGVCASCLRDRLQPILEAQAKAQAQPSHFVASETDPLSSQPNFPRSVSPYVNCRKSDDRRREVLFHTMAEVEQGVSAACDGGTVSSSKRRFRRFWILSNLFRLKSNKTDNSSRESCEPSSSVTPPSLTWLSTIVPARRQNNRVSDQRRCSQLDRGASPVESFDGRDLSATGCSSESSPQRRNKTTAITTRRSRLGYAGKSLTSMALCLSPLVRASPNRHWNSHKGLAQELGAGGVHHISTAASFCANRSRKLVDFGRIAHNR